MNFILCDFNSKPYLDPDLEKLKELSQKAVYENRSLTTIEGLANAVMDSYNEYRRENNLQNASIVKVKVQLLRIQKIIKLLLLEREI